jgi:hypothetical protein
MGQLFMAIRLLDLALIPGRKSDSAKNFTFDDTNTSQISYTGSWTLESGSIPAGKYHNSTFQ